MATSTTNGAGDDGEEEKKTNRVDAETMNPMENMNRAGYDGNREGKKNEQGESRTTSDWSGQGAVGLTRH